MFGKVEDGRIGRTRAALHSAVARLIHEKPWDSISVREILARANVARSTFYAHFTGKDELLVSGIEAMLRAARAPGARRERIVGFARPLFDHIDEQRAARSALIRFRSRALVHERLRRSLASILAEDVRREFGEDAAAILPDYLAATFVFVLDWWLDRHSDMPPADAERMFRSLAEPVVATLAGPAEKRSTTASRK